LRFAKELAEFRSSASRKENSSGVEDACAATGDEMLERRKLR
jgi:hypothetical protein